MRTKQSARHAGFCLATIFMALATACTRGAERPPSYFSDYTTFDLAMRQEYAGYREVVGSYLRQAAEGRTARACIIGLTQGGTQSDMVWVIWRDGDRLIRWFPGEDNLMLSSRNLSLTDDVVPTDSDIGTSTYLVSRPWVIELERLCEHHGRRVTRGQANL